MNRFAVCLGCDTFLISVDNRDLSDVLLCPTCAETLGYYQEQYGKPEAVDEFDHHWQDMGGEG